MVRIEDGRSIKPDRIRRQLSTVVELRAYRDQSKGSQLRLKCAKTGAWYFQNDRPHKFGGSIAARERKGFRVTVAYWLPNGAKVWRPISLDDVRERYRYEAPTE